GFSRAGLRGWRQWFDGGGSSSGAFDVMKPLRIPRTIEALLVLGAVCCLVAAYISHHEYIRAHITANQAITQARIQAVVTWINTTRFCRSDPMQALSLIFLELDA